MKNIAINTEFIKLDSFLKYAGLYPSGGEAKAAIENGEVAVNGQPCAMRGKKLRPGDTVSACGETFTVEKTV
jgi:ribosome-associated protein